MRRIWLVLLAVVLLAGVPSGFAQNKKKGEEQNRSVKGAVHATDDQAVTGAVVQLKNTKTLQVRSFITKEDGTYYFLGLSPDVDYELRADFQGASSGTKTLSSFDSRKEAIVNLKLNPKK
ncbi:MAG TPA: carboxypeptidase-like regulatory domain-containing protein [Bryobacteraceae bacterium]|nr:carboxypeptidase-like regulatory domain-containing protein [Bryobacteraceae bacterium]